MRSRDSVDAGLARTALRNAAIKRVVGAFAAVTVGEWVLGTTVAVHAYAVGGAVLVGLVGLRFFPAAVAGLFTAQFAETHRRDIVLTATAFTRTIVSGLTVAALATKLPFAVPLGLVWIDAMIGSAYRPAQATLLPSLVHSPSEFAAASALTSLAKSSGQMFGALAGGLLVAGLPIEIAVSASTGLYAVSTLATIGLRSAAPPLRARIGLGGRLRRMRDGLAALSGDREAQEIVAFACLRSLIRGLWMSLGVVASLELLGLGKAGFGVLMAAAGAGALLAIPLSALLVGKRLLAHWLAGALVACGALIAAIGGAVAGGAAVVFMVGWGMGMAISDVAGQAVLFRVVAPSAIARVTGLMESGKLMFEGGAAMLAPLAVLVFGIRGALIFAGALVVAIVIAGARSFTRIDRRAVGRLEALHLVSGVELFHRLRVDLLEGVVARLRPLSLAAETDVTRQGERDDGGWYLVGSGRLAVLIDGYTVNELQRGDGFGEIALLRDRPRAATVRSLTDVELFALDRASFMTAVAGGDIDLSADAASATGAQIEDPAELLRQTPILQGIGPKALALVAHHSSILEVASGEEIISEGELEDAFYILLAGRARVLVAGETRRELLPGDGFGEIAVLHRVPRSATVLALEDCRLLSVPGADLREAVKARGGMIGRLAADVPEPSVDQKIRAPAGPGLDDATQPL